MLFPLFKLSQFGGKSGYRASQGEDEGNS